MRTLTAFDRPGSQLRQWAGVVGTPLIWFVQMELAYALVPTACHDRSTLIEHVSFVVALVLVALGGWSSYGIYRLAEAAREGTKTFGPEGRAKFLGLVGVMVSAFMFLLIAAQWLPVFLVHPCVLLQP
jgi:hypothetical protein